MEKPAESNRVANQARAHKAQERHHEDPYAGLAHKVIGNVERRQALDAVKEGKVRDVREPAAVLRRVHHDRHDDDKGIERGGRDDGCDHDAESYADKEHVVAYAKKVKAAGMAFLLDIHYSDNWADPGKQIIPSRWRNVQSSDALADSIYNYTYDLVNTLKQVGATPDMVQVGNETTPGILIHVPNANTNCWGDNVDKAPTSINGDMGTAAGKVNAAKYFKAGIRAVKAVSQDIKTVLHIESIHKTSTVDWWMNEIFKNQKVPADVMGFSAYTAYNDGPPENWKSLFEKVTAGYPNLEFIVAEYNGGDAENHYSFDGSRGRTDEMIRGMDRWIGAFFWEPTLSGKWGSALFDWKGSDLYANKNAFEEYKPTKKEKDPQFH
jgi:arabinogalactan endo-1,4-beta-galactosidase